MLSLPDEEMPSFKSQAISFGRCQEPGCRWVFTPNADIARLELYTGHVRQSREFKCNFCGAVFESVRQRTKHKDATGHKRARQARKK